MKPLKWLLIVLLCVAGIIWGAWVIVLPEDLLLEMLQSPQGDITLNADGLRKGLVFNLKADAVTIIKEGEDILRIEDAKLRLNPLELFILRASLRFEGNVSGGEITGTAVIKKKGLEASLRIEGAEVSDIAFIKRLGLLDRGVISGQLIFKDSTGEAKVSLNNALFKDRTFSGVPLPLHIFSGAKAAFSIKEGLLSITSFSLEGDGIYARLKGEIRGSAMDLKAELMPQAGFKEKIYLIPLERYQTSPGYYVIPVKGDLKGQFAY